MCGLALGVGGLPSPKPSPKRRGSSDSLPLRGIEGGQDYVQQAGESYRAARAITSAAGIVGRALRLFDALAVVDEAGILAGVRDAIAGEG